MRRLLTFLLPVLLLPAAAAAQDDDAPAQRGRPRFALVPQIALGGIGRRWKEDVEDGVELGPGTGPLLGIALHFDPPGRAAFDAMGGWTRSGYAWEGGGANAPEGRAGKIHLVRVAGSFVWRLREGAPGYFSIGGGALYYRPIERVVAGSGASSTALFDDEEQWMPLAHVGAGYDLTRDGHTLRIDGRLYGSRADQDVVHQGGGAATFGGNDLRARVAFDLLISIGYLIRL